MRYLRISVMILFVFSAILYVGADVLEKNMSDHTYPEITCTEEVLELSVADPQETLFRGLTASDKKDGDLTKEIMISGISFFTDPGVCKVNYVVFDSANHSAVYEREVRYTDYTSPKFYASEPLVYYVGDNIRYLDYITAQDVIDGDISRQIKIKSSSLSSYYAGVYPILLEVMNSHGDISEIEVNVVVREGRAQAAEIRLNEYISYVNRGDSFDPYACIKSVVGNDGTQLNADAVIVKGTVDTSQAGCYHLTYSLGNEDGSGDAYLTVVVRDEEIA